MSSSLVILIAALLVAALGWILWRQLASRHMQRLAEQRKATSRLVGRAELVDGNRHVPVSLALTDTTFFYENPDMSACVDLRFIEEVEYEHELLTGQAVHSGTVLRLRCFSKVFEFVVDSASVPQWQAVLPAVRMAR